MELGEIIDKQVVSSHGEILGNVCELRFNEDTWTVTDFSMELENTVVETMGFQRPRLMGSVKVYIPIGEVNGISDFVSLKKSAVELKSIVKRT